MSSGCVTLVIDNNPNGETSSQLDTSCGPTLKNQRHPTLVSNALQLPSGEVSQGAGFGPHKLYSTDDKL